MRCASDTRLDGFAIRYCSVYDLQPIVSINSAPVIQSPHPAPEMRHRTEFFQ